MTLFCSSHKSPHYTWTCYLSTSKAHMLCKYNYLMKYGMLSLCLFMHCYLSGTAIQCIHWQDNWPISLHEIYFILYFLDCGISTIFNSQNQCINPPWFKGIAINHTNLNNEGLRNKRFHSCCEYLGEPFYREMNRQTDIGVFTGSVVRIRFESELSLFSIQTIYIV